ncbi:hypothetical protein LTR70_000925 [Exophiala xenobiotica]|uniref:Uncharacterized protein n=1 Tax=Lithohypha guttulata TaxID=1690604 RepID=A0ABR0KLQ7_9EURO|nr:hypothetical protein LTR24_001583 [Lithohypha guttulata]KAK5329089.1 hypothetical protein LTR70_000925 [Exophiala xenobiotica]
MPPSGTEQMIQVENNDVIQDLETSTNAAQPTSSREVTNFQPSDQWHAVQDPNLPMLRMVPLPDNLPSVEATTSAVEFDDSYLADFLRDILHPADAAADQHDIVFAPKDFLDFNIPTSYEYLDDYDLPHLGTNEHTTLPINGGGYSCRPEQPVVNLARSGHASPTGRNGLSLSAQAFKES